MFVLSINHTPLRRYINIDNLSTLLMKHSKFAKPGRPSYFEYTSVFPNCTILRKNFVCSRNTREFSLQVVVTSLKTVLNSNNFKTKQLHIVTFSICLMCINIFQYIHKSVLIKLILLTLHRAVSRFNFHQS